MPTKTRAGNWFEENVLEEYTGVAKFDIKDPSMKTLTTQRCIEHTERTDPKNYKSVQAECIQNPRLNPEFELLKDKVGPRRAKLENEMKEMVETQFSQTQAAAYTANRKVEYVSEYGRNFHQEGGSKDLPARANLSSNYVTDQPITFYTDSVEKGSVTFPTTMALTSNPFRRSSAFSVNTKMEPSAQKSESNERPRHLPTVKEHANLKSLREKMLSSCQAKLGASAKYSVDVVGPVIDAIWGIMDDSEKGTTRLDHLLQFLEWEHDVVPTDGEKFALLSAFDVNATNCIDIPSFTDYLAGAIVVEMDENGRPTTGGDDGQQ